MINHQRLSAVLLLLPLSLCAVPAAAETEKQKLQQIEKQIQNLAGEIGSDKKTRSSLVAYLSATEKQIGQYSSTLRKLKQQSAQLDSRLQELTQIKSRQNSQLALYRQQLRELLLSAYANGRQEKLKLFLNQQDPASINRMMSYYKFLNQQRLRQIELAQQLLVELQQTEQEIAGTRSGIEISLQEQTQEYARLQQARAERSKVIAQLDAQISDKQQSLKKLQQDRQALANLLSNIEKQQKQQQQERQLHISKLRGKLPWPTSGTIVKSYGSSKAGDMRWDGVLISAPEGREVKAIHYGRVAYSDWLRGYGLLTIIDHGNGVMSLYGHNQSLLKEVGEWVDKLEPIALTGNSGGLTQSGLYFSIRNKGKPFNPVKWCKKPRGKKI